MSDESDIAVITDQVFTPLKNKKWLFPETGRGGFHYKDVSYAVTGLKMDLINNYPEKQKDDIISWIEKWFPDVSNNMIRSTMKQSEETTLEAKNEERPLTITTFG